MNIDELTIGEARELAAIFGGNKAESKPHGAIGKKCIVRAYASGVHYGEVVSVESNDGRSRCELKKSRRLWYWKTVKGISLSDLAINGIDPVYSKVCEEVPRIFIEDAIEFIPASADAIKSIEEQAVYNA